MYDFMTLLEILNDDAVSRGVSSTRGPRGKSSEFQDDRVPLRFHVNFQQSCEVFDDTGSSELYDSRCLDEDARDHASLART